jgi:predicted ArsR family transcriptional regulator
VRVLRSLLEDGPAAASVLADRLGITAAGIRRHLDVLVESGLVQAGERAPYGPTGPRGRGRPAKVYAITDRGRDAAGPSDGALAIEALRYLRRTHGSQAVRDFAVDRMAERSQRFRDALADVPADERAARLADLLTAEGFAASLDDAPSALGGQQMCQHHCPVGHAAAEFPELCEAEAEMFSRLLDSHVQRLATLAHGDGVCTTYLPSTDPRPRPPRSRR